MLISAEQIGALHYGTNPALVGTPDEYIKALGNAPVRVLAINPGDALEF